VDITPFLCCSQLVCFLFVLHSYFVIQVNLVSAQFAKYQTPPWMRNICYFALNSVLTNKCSRTLQGYQSDDEITSRTTTTTKTTTTTTTTATTTTQSHTTDLSISCNSIDILMHMCYIRYFHNLPLYFIYGKTLLLLEK
jgi:hypothetical protein